jgi:hypothetical protein
MIRDGTMAAVEHLKAKPMAAGVAAGLLASLCCGGSLIFASVGLGAFYSALGLSRYTPQALAAGALSILAINYLYYRHAAKRESTERAPVLLRQKMFISTAIGMTVMAGSFIFMEWLNHAVVHGDRFLARPEYGQAFIKGVPNQTLLYVCATFFALVVLGALPFPGRDPSDTKNGLAGKVTRVAVFGATTILLFGVLLDASSKVSGTMTGQQHGRAH